MTTRVRAQRIHHMKWPAMAAGILLCLFAGTAAVSAQLGDVAKKEAERRKVVKPSDKTYTNDNIKPAPPVTAVPPSSTSSSEAATTDKATTDKTATDNAATDKAATDKAGTDKAAADKAGTDKTDKPATPPQVSSDPAERKKEEAAWRERIKNAREALDRATTFADALQSKINALNTDFVNRDDPVQRSKIAADREKALADLGRAKKEIEHHTKTIAGIQEEARRANVPAGWLR